jgi:hypothetical protein
MVVFFLSCLLGNGKSIFICIEKGVATIQRVFDQITRDVIDFKLLIANYNISECLFCLQMDTIKQNVFFWEGMRSATI